MCVSDWWKSKYKTLRAAAVLLGQMHRKTIKDDTKNWQRVVQMSADIIRAYNTRKDWPEALNPEVLDMAYKLRSLGLDTIRQRQ